MGYELHLGDCLKVLPSLPENSIDSVVTDLHYGIRFMGIVGIAAAMKLNGIRNAQEAWQNMGLHLMLASPKAQDGMVKSDSSDFILS